MYSQEFLKALKKKAYFEDNNLMYYCWLFISISKNLVLKQRLDWYTQCQWFLQELPEKIMIEIFYWYNINLENNGNLDFDNLLEKSLILVKCRKYLADFIQNKEIDLVNKYKSSEKVFIVSKIVKTFINPTRFTQFKTV